MRMAGIDHSTYIKRLKERLRQKPDSALFLSLAEELRKRDRIDEALALLSEGIKKNPSFVAARLTLGRWYRWNNMLAEARKELSDAAVVSPDNIFVHKELAETSRQLGDTALAAEAYRNVLALDPLDREAAAFLESLGPSAEVLEPVEERSLAAEGTQQSGGGEDRRDERAGASVMETVEAKGADIIEPRELRRFQPSAELLQQAEELIAAEEYGRAIEIYNRLLKANPHHSPTLQKKGELTSLMKLNGADRRAVVARLETFLRLIKERCALQRDQEKEAALRKLQGLLESIRTSFAPTP